MSWAIDGEIARISSSVVGCRPEDSTASRMRRRTASGPEVDGDAPSRSGITSEDSIPHCFAENKSTPMGERS